MIQGLSTPWWSHQRFVVWGRDASGWMLMAAAFGLTGSLRLRGDLWLLEIWSRSQRYHLLLRWGEA
jgi:hypothetical protein